MIFCFLFLIASFYENLCAIYGNNDNVISINIDKYSGEFSLINYEQGLCFKCWTSLQGTEGNVENTNTDLSLALCRKIFMETLCSLYSFSSNHGYLRVIKVW